MYLIFQGSPRSNPTLSSFQTPPNLPIYHRNRLHISICTRHLNWRQNDFNCHRMLWWVSGTRKCFANILWDSVLTVQISLTIIRCFEIVHTCGWRRRIEKWTAASPPPKIGLVSPLVVQSDGIEVYIHVYSTVREMVSIPNVGMYGCSGSQLTEYRFPEEKWLFEMQHRLHQWTMWECSFGVDGDATTTWDEQSEERGVDASMDGTFVVERGQ